MECNHKKANFFESMILTQYCAVNISDVIIQTNCMPELIKTYKLRAV